MLNRFLRLPEVLKVTGLSKSHTYFLIADQRFPKPVNLCDGRAVGWLESEIDEWVNERMSAREVS